MVANLNDGSAADIDNQTDNTQLSANWAASSDTHSDIERYWYAIGSTSGGTDVVNWTDNWFNTSFNHTGLSLNFGSTYYISVKTENGAGLITSEVTSDGIQIDNPTDPPVANFTIFNSNICAGDSIQLVNSSSDATSYSWTASGGTLSSSTAASPYITFNTSGTYTINLTASGPGGSDLATQSISISVGQPPVAQASANANTILINNTLTFTNNSINSDGYFWDFGDGNTSTDANPWNVYSNVGNYDVLLIAINGTCENDTLIIPIEVVDNSNLINIEGIHDIELFPNPNDGIFNLELVIDQTTLINISILDVTGKLIYTENEKLIHAGKNLININAKENNEFSHGLYYLNITTIEGTQTLKFLITE